MPELEDIVYSRDASVAAIRGYYEFLTQMYLEPSVVEYPPAAGWSSITEADPDALEDLGKSDEVISLLAHLPYVANPTGDGSAPQPVPDCVFADWHKMIEHLDQQSGSDLRLTTEGAEFYEDAPPHVVGLTCGGRDNPVIVLDTELGIVHWPDCPHRIMVASESMVEDDPYDYAPENEAEWRADAPAWAVPDFFELLKDQFRELHFIPISSRAVLKDDMSYGPDTEGMMPMLREIYREHGWPDLDMYRKKECLKAVRDAMQERYPDLADFAVDDPQIV